VPPVDQNRKDLAPGNTQAVYKAGHGSSLRALYLNSLAEAGPGHEFFQPAENAYFQPHIIYPR
jgi:hypothetical protein